jgi:hypothetical protein
METEKNCDNNCLQTDEAEKKALVTSQEGKQ